MKVFQTKQTNSSKEGVTIMKLTKKKVVALSLVICLIAIASLGTLAWFNAQDEVTNNFYIANSEDDADDIFSVDVWEDNTPEDVDGEPKLDGIEFENILPGDKLFKEVHIENTGSYDQYIRATITISDASLWQDVYGERLVPLADFVNYNTAESAPIFKEVAYYDAANDAFVYQLYYDKAIAADEEFVVFDTVTISEALDRFQAAELAGSFEIKVIADAVQVQNVGNNVYEAFETVGLVKAIPVSTPEALADALASDKEAYLIIDTAALTNDTLTIDSAIENKTLDFNGAAAKVAFTANASAENVLITGIYEDANNDLRGANITVPAGFTGTVTIANSSFISNSGTADVAIAPVSGNVIVDNCSFESISKSYAIRTNGTTGNLTVTNSSFKNFTSWPIIINGTLDGSALIDNCEFENLKGLFKTLGGGVTGNFTFTNNTF